VTPSDLVAATLPVVNAFERLEVSYFVGGSVASSAHGLPRTTLDVDLVADLKHAHVAPLVEQLQAAYYVDADMIYDAIDRRSSFNVIHLETMLKVDVFVLKQEPYDQTAFRRAQAKHPLLSQESTVETRFVLASAEDVVLHKLLWYRMGGEVSDRQWTDVLGVLKVQGAALDLTYMKHWADDLDVADLLDRALHEAGLHAPGA